MTSQQLQKAAQYDSRCAILTLNQLNSNIDNQLFVLTSGKKIQMNKTT